MAKVGVKVKLGANSLKELEQIILDSFEKQARGNFGDFRPIVEEAINKAVVNTKEEFIPDDDEAAELGVGEGGLIDRSRTEGAWKQLLTRGPNSVMSFSVRRARGKGLIGNITVSYTEEALLEAPLSNVLTPDSFEIRSIPWLKWLIRGAPTNSSFEFTEETTGSFSRTGGGVMIKGGIWRFSPVRPRAFISLNSEIEKQIIRSVEQTATEVI